MPVNPVQSAARTPDAERDAQVRQRCAYRIDFIRKEKFILLVRPQNEMSWLRVLKVGQMPQHRQHRRKAAAAANQAARAGARFVQHEVALRAARDQRVADFGAFGEIGGKRATRTQTDQKLQPPVPVRQVGHGIGAATIRAGNAELHILTWNKIRCLAELRVRFEQQSHRHGACASRGERLYRRFAAGNFVAANSGLRVGKIDDQIAARLAAAEENAVLTGVHQRLR